jgi:hypothetical protein
MRRMIEHLKPLKPTRDTRFSRSSLLSRLQASSVCCGNERRAKLDFSQECGSGLTLFVTQSRQVDADRRSLGNTPLAGDHALTGPIRAAEHERAIGSSAPENRNSSNVMHAMSSWRPILPISRCPRHLADPSVAHGRHPDG